MGQLISAVIRCLGGIIVKKVSLSIGIINSSMTSHSVIEQYALMNSLCPSYKAPMHVLFGSLSSIVLGHE